MVENGLNMLEHMVKSLCPFGIMLFARMKVISVKWKGHALPVNQRRTSTKIYTPDWQTRPSKS